MYMPMLQVRSSISLDPTSHRGASGHMKKNIREVMLQDTGIQILLRALAYLDAISEPVNIEEFSGLELTGDTEADAMLRSLALGMLQQWRSLDMVRADGAGQSGSKIYGLTPHGKDVYARLRRLASCA